jgi:hypothetical protein
VRGSSSPSQRDLPTHIHNVTKRWTRLDQVFLSDHSLDLLITCDTQLDKQGICTDHLPIVTELNVTAAISPNEEHYNFREVDWATFNTSLGQRLSKLRPTRQDTLAGPTGLMLQQADGGNPRHTSRRQSP